MDAIKNLHLEANANYWKYDLLLNAQSVLQKLRDSKTLKIATRGSDKIQNMVFLLENKANFAMDDINNLVDFEVTPNDKGITEFTLYVNNTYFTEHDMIEQLGGRLTRKYLAKKKVSRQEMIDNFEKEIRKTYSKVFAGKIIEDDGQVLSVMK